MNKLLLILGILIFPVALLADGTTINRSIQWTGIQQVPVGGEQSLPMLRFEGSVHVPDSDHLPNYYETYSLPADQRATLVELRHALYSPLSPEESVLVSNSEYAAEEIAFTIMNGFDRKKAVAQISFIPIRKNPLTGQYEKLVRFSLEIITEPQTSLPATFKNSTVTDAVLASGNWYKLSVTKTGIYRITYQQLLDMGLQAGTLNPKNIRIYGLPGGMLPENIEAFRYPDLQQAAIYVSGEEDGSFDPSDYILFYGESPHVLKYSDEYQLMRKQMHLYDDETYYFLTTDLGEGKRVPVIPLSTQTPSNFINRFHDALHYEIEKQNLLNSGRIWYGETFDLYNNMVQEFSITNLDLEHPMNLWAEAAARSKSASNFQFYINNDVKLQLNIPGTNISNINGDFAKVRSDTTRFYPPSSEIAVKVVYTKSTNASVGYLDYFTLNFARDLAFNGGQLSFRHLSTAASEVISEYSLSKVNENVIVWDVTNPLNAARMETVLSGTTLKFVQQSDTLRQFIAFDGTGYLEASFIGEVQNQNLHGIDPHEMIILTHSLFRAEAERLAQFHRDYNNMSVYVTEPQMIYHEFSAGTQDITAIRDFMKWIYDKAAAGAEPRYLLLFGDGSFDYKDRVENNTNYVPTWESYQSLNPVNSYVKDDFYVLLDDAGDTFVDMGVGRFVVSTEDQARSIVDKTIHYATHSDAVTGDWRNIICLIADDEDSNLHFGDAEDLATIIDTTDHAINIDKIYLDAYQQRSTPSGERYPDATLDINNRVERGALIVNYVGHGGEGGLAHERIMTINDINSWDNLDNMPVFITATCEFSRFDDPERTSAGEYVSLNPKGGGIALFTTTRATYAGANFDLNRNFYLSALKEEDGQHLRMGDIIRLAKNASGSVENKSKFMLIGDPALRIAFPEHNVITASINNISVSQAIDTIKALSKVTIQGDIRDHNNNLLSDFNGILYPTVFDKPSNFNTLGNDPGSFPEAFEIQKNALYKGKTTVENGSWEFTFIAPKDLAYQYGFGKISYYASNGTMDGNGYFSEVVVGGYNEDAEIDNEGPQVELFMNDLWFQRGGLTDENPDLFAMIFDESGINTVGNGIGHDIIATLDGQKSFVLNNYYEAELNSYQQGSILYPFYSLDNGRHTLSLKVWDIYNNSTTTHTDFIVAESVDMAIDELINYPNPFSDYTTFSFEHNQVEQPLDITIYIHSLDGRLVATLNDIYNAGGYRYNSVVWEGTDGQGNKLMEGMYVYRVLVKNYDGSVEEKTNKLVIIK